MARRLAEASQGQSQVTLELQKVEMAFREAVTKNEVERVRQILTQRRTIPIDDPVLGNEPALHLAVKRGWVAMAKLLLEFNADVNAKNNHDNQTSLHACIRYKELEILKLLVPLKPQPNVKDREGNTPLHLAAANSQSEEIVRLLLTLGADPMVKDQKGQIPKDIFQSHGCAAQAQILAICEPIFKARTSSTKGLDLSKQLRTIANPLSVFGPFLFTCAQLVSLNLASNLIETVPVDLKLLVMLELLDLSDNRLARLPPLNTLKNLKRLDVRANRLIALPPELGNMQQLKELLVAENPLGTIPLGIDRNSTVELKNYLYSLFTSDGRPARRVKLLVLGPEGVGKTSLIECLRAVAIQPRTNYAAAPTVKGEKKSVLESLTSKVSAVVPSKDEKRGADLRVQPGAAKVEAIDISSITLDEDVTFGTYDFGREEIIYPTHQFFITSNAIYVLMFHMAEINRTAIEHWLQTIKARTGNFNCPVLIVGTHADEVPNREAMEKELSEKWMAVYKSAGFVHIQGMAFVSCKTKEGILKLRDLLVGIAKNKLAATVNEVIPNSYISVLEYLYQLRLANVATLEWNEFKEIPAKVNQYSLASDEKLSVMAKCFHKLGEIIYFEYDSILKDYIILDPLTLVRLMTTVISLKTHYCKDGILKGAIIPTVWKAFPSESHQTLLHVLKKFEIIFPLREDYLVPCLLPERPASEQEQLAVWPPLMATEVSTRQFGRRYVFAFLPVGLFWRIMARLMGHTLITPIYKWRYGLVVRMGDQSSLITADVKGQFVTIVVREPGKVNATPKLPQDRAKSLLKTLMVMVEGLVEQFYPSANKDLCRFVPCSHCYARIKHTKGGTMEVSFERENSVHLFTYEECLEALAQGNTLLECPNEGSAVVPIATVAPDILKDEPIPNDEITRELILGTGGYGRVYKGVWKAANVEAVPVAIKELLEDGEEYQALFQGFQLEAYIMSNLNHPNIVKLYGTTLYPLALIMELMPFGDLHDLIEPHLKAVAIEEIQSLHLPIDAVVVVEGEGDEPGTYKVLTERNTRGSVSASKIKLRKAPLPDSALSSPMRMKILLDIARGMNYLATRSPPIVHRDLRSPNVFISHLDLDKQMLTAKIADFGLAREVVQETSGILKAWQWLAPEVIDPDKNEYDEKSDIYSYGMVCWEVLTRGTPFDEYYEDPRFQRMGAFQAMSCKMAVFKEGLRPTIPANADPEMRRVIEGCWKADPQQRISFEDIDITFTMYLGVQPEAALSHRKPTFNSLRTKVRNETVSTAATNDFLAFRQRLLPTNADYAASPVMCLLHIPALRQVWSGNSGGLISVWDVHTKTLLKWFEAHNPPTVTCLVLVKDEVWSVGVDEEMHVWDAKTCKRLKTLKGHKSPVRLVVHLSDESLWSIDSIGTICVWSGSQKRRVESFSVDECIYSSCLIELWLGGHGNIFRVSVTNFMCTKMSNVHDGPITAIVLAPNGRVWSASQDQHIKGWDVRSYAQVSDIRDVKARINALVIYPGKKNVLVSGSSDKRIVCFDLDYLTNMQMLEGNHSHAMKCLLVVGRDVWAGSLDHTITIWTAPANLNQQQFVEKETPLPIQSRTFIPIRPSSNRETELAAAQVQGMLNRGETPVSPRPSMPSLAMSRVLSIRSEGPAVKKEDEEKRMQDEARKRVEEAKQREEDAKKREEDKRKDEERRKEDELRRTAEAVRVQEEKQKEEERKREEEKRLTEEREEKRRRDEEARKRVMEKRNAEQQKVDAEKNAVKNAAEARQRAVLMAWQAQLAGQGAPSPSEPEDDKLPPPPTQPAPVPPQPVLAKSASQRHHALAAALENDLADLLSDLDRAVAAKSASPASSPSIGSNRQPAVVSSVQRTPLPVVTRSPSSIPSNTASPTHNDRPMAFSPAVPSPQPQQFQTPSDPLSTSGRIRRIGDNPLMSGSRNDILNEHGDKVLLESDFDAPPRPRQGW